MVEINQIEGWYLDGMLTFEEAEERLLAVVDEAPRLAALVENILTEMVCNLR